MSAIALLTDHHQYFLYGGVADMRNSIDGLCGIVKNELGREVNHKDVFIFLNKKGTHIKLLLQEADGFTLLFRRLHKGRFIMPDIAEGEAAIQMSATQLLSMLSGLHLHRSKKTA
ncbi:IS66 family insertion sequence element accessory protein TnpB [Flavitalea sp.]|nr:IS66 family insertion sequence element accessory protein TnpB [Flavitalea sp.]